MSQHIGSYLEALRLSCGYSLREASRRSGLSHGYIRDVEIGVNRKSGSPIIPMPQTLRKYADAYRADFNELMQIAGHFQRNETEGAPYEMVQIDLYSVLFVQVIENNLVKYYLSDRVFSEEKSLHEYMILEETLERNNFLRIEAGIYVNLLQIRAFDEINRRIFFDEESHGKFLEISHHRYTKFRSTINRAITRNNNMVKEIKFQPKRKPSMVVRNIL